MVKLSRYGYAQYSTPFVFEVAWELQGAQNLIKAQFKKKRRYVDQTLGSHDNPRDHMEYSVHGAFLIQSYDYLFRTIETLELMSRTFCHMF